MKRLLVFWLVGVLFGVGIGGIVTGWIMQNDSEYILEQWREAVDPNSHSFEDLLDTIEWIESRGVATAIGKNGEVGAYQIKDIYLDDYVRITGDDWFVDHPKDMRLEKWFSRKVTEAVIKHYAHVTWPNLDINDPQFIETAARSHKRPPERTKESTKEYWEKVKARLERKEL